MVRWKLQVVKVWTKLVAKVQWEVLMRIALVILLAFIIMLAVAIGVQADELEQVGYIQANPIRPGQLDVVDDDGDVVYQLQQDRLRLGRWLIYDDDYNLVGTIERNPIRLYRQDIYMKDRFKKSFRRFSSSPGNDSLRFRRFND